VSKLPGGGGGRRDVQSHRRGVGGNRDATAREAAGDSNRPGNTRSKRTAPAGPRVQQSSRRKRGVGTIGDDELAVTLVEAN
jgi:hypothetical protein